MASSDEGEIIESGQQDFKATTPADIHGTGVDRRDRQRGRTPRSPDSHDTRALRSPAYRNPSPRGYKRSHDDREHRTHGGRGSDSRQFRVHYEDAPRRDARRPGQYDDAGRPASRAHSGRYEDLDRPSSYATNEPRDNRARRLDDSERDWDRDRYPSKRHRTRSRSPYSAAEHNGRGQRDRDRQDLNRFDRHRNGEQAESTQYSAQHDQRSRGDHFSKQDLVADRDVKGVAKSTQVVAAKASAEASSQNPEQSSANEGTSEGQQDWEQDKPLDEEAEIERRRRRREEILKKSRALTPMHALAVQIDQTSVSTPDVSTRAGTPTRSEAHTPSAGTPGMSPAPLSSHALSPEPIDLANDQELINSHAHVEADAHVEDGPSAADYDPTADMQEDERRDEMRHGAVGLHGQERRGSIITTEAEKPLVEEPAPKQTDNVDEDDDDFDMFADDFDETKYAAPKAAKGDTGNNGSGLPAQIAQGNAGGILEGDDKDGYYKIRPGEVLDGRYQIQSTLGKGMFSGVARATDIVTKELVAIKMMRNNDALRKGGFTEIAILQKLNDADPENKRHIVKFERSFEYKGHLCMIFENLSLNLREVLKKFGNNVGINLKGVRVYAYQIFVSLAHMRKCSIIHADLKPDNILVNDARNILKICDLGTAIDRSDAATAHNEITPYLVSRFYRAPEIILGMPYDYAVDMWSIGCTLYELYTGKILFTGDSNNQMLRTIMEIRGKMSGKLYRRGDLWRLHFDDVGNFVSQERDKILGKTTLKILPLIKPTRDLRTRLMAASSGMSETELKELNLFHDLLQACLNLNPDKRITPTDALRHPFFTSRVQH